MKKGQGRWSRLLRRAAALFLATVTVWVLSLTANIAAAADTFRALAESPAFVSAALRAELGEVEAVGGVIGGMTSWQKLVLGQSPALMAGEGRVTSLLSGQETPPKLESAPTPVEPDDPDDVHSLPQVTVKAGDVIGRTLIPTSGEGYDSAGSVYIENRPGLPLDVAALAAMPLSLSLPAEGPQVLIMHTHGTEAYTPDGTDLYAASDTSRTTDPNFNMIRVGDEIEKVLTGMGLSVIHDKNLYDYPNYNGSYDRSLAAVQQYLKDYPTIKVVMDVHRDALIGNDGTIYKPITTIDGVPAAQVMLVMGSEAAGLSHPKWQENLSLACRVQGEMNILWPTLARPIGLREHRYNQQCTTGSLLVEVGSHGNTLQEALAGARMFARAAGAVLLDYKG
ncbi:MAG: stage II sporulation protein P [Clostridia bacterium]|nr:stage II sporulation protein P [Clostridia bacterium]